MAAHRVHNFNAGPAALPLNVLEKLQKEFLDFQGCGMNVMEVSHRGKEFEPIIRQAEKDMRELMQIPANYKVLFMQGGGTAQFSAVPLNLLGDKKKADYIITGGWSKKAAEEAAKYCEVHVVASSEKINFTAIPSADSFNFTQDGSSAYVYYCANETVHGVEFADIPAVPAGTTLVADVSSDFLSSKVDVSRFGLIYAGAQKNVGPSGVTVVIVREDLLGKAAKTCPLVLDYKVYAQNESMYNTPPTWSIYVTGEVLKHLLNIGGLDAVAATNLAKSNLLYSALDESKIYKPLVAREHRSKMNVVFHVADKSGKRDPTLEKKLADKATEAGFIGIAGHRSVGGMRVSLYNAVTLESTKALVAFLKNFEADVLA